jgi:hypothetical protein
MRYTIEWETTETTTHRASVDAETMAAMIGVSVEALAACADADEIERLDGERGLDNGLADIEDDGTEVNYDGPYREVTTITLRKRKA